MKPLSPQRAVRLEGILPNPKLKLLAQVREVLRLKHYSIRTERCYCDWTCRYVRDVFTRSQSTFSLTPWL